MPPRSASPVGIGFGQLAERGDLARRSDRWREHLRLPECPLAREVQSLPQRAARSPVRRKLPRTLLTSKAPETEPFVSCVINESAHERSGIVVAEPLLVRQRAPRRKCQRVADRGADVLCTAAPKAAAGS